MGCSASTIATRARRSNRVALCIALSLFVAGCGRLWRSLYLSDCDAKIKKATNAIQTAKNSGQSATAYADRGDAYAEKARYSRAFKLISSKEYDRLFGLAIQDHGQAIALDPDNPDMYYRRGR